MPLIGLTSIGFATKPVAVTCAWETAENRATRSRDDPPSTTAIDLVRLMAFSFFTGEKLRSAFIFVTANVQLTGASKASEAPLLVRPWERKVRSCVVARLHESMPSLNEFSHRQREQSSELATDDLLVSLQIMPR
jgi:hypothetical protein